METPKCQGVHNYRVFVGQFPSRKGQLGKPQSGHISCECVCQGWDGTVLDTLQAAVGAGFGQAGAPGSSECVWSPQLSITASCSSGDLSRTSCLAAVMCQAGLHEALFRIDLGVMPWHSWPFILELCHSVSHLCVASAALRLAAGTAVLKSCLCFSVSPVSFLLSLLTCNVLKSS